VDPANEPYEKPAVPEPPTTEERLPVIDLSELPGLWPADVVEAYPGIRDPVSPDEAIEGASPLPTRGDATTDVFGIGEESAEHLALIGVEPKNDLGTDGAWSEGEISLDPVTGGWSWTDPAGLRFTFPVVLSSVTPVLVEIGSASLSLAPTSVLPGDVSSAGIVDGSSVTYPGAVAGHDLVYTATPLGVQEQIILEKPPDDPTFKFTIATKGVTLTPNLYGGLDVTGDDGTQIGTIPVAVADDSSAEVASSPAPTS
jgi:hypothetical protein